MPTSGTPQARLADQLQANTVERRKLLAESDWETIDGSIRALDASGIRSAVARPGQIAPDFELANADGVLVRSATLRAKGPLVVEFYRGSWCSYCNVEVRALMQVLDEIRRLGGDMVAAIRRRAERQGGHCTPSADSAGRQPSAVRRGSWCAEDRRR